MKKILSLIIVTLLIVQTALSFEVQADDNNSESLYRINGLEVSIEDVTISEEAAEIIAEMFLEDIQTSRDVEWNEQTNINGRVTLWGLNSNVNAYAFELTTGYIIVSARMDHPTVILEWSDIADPCYSLSSERSKFYYFGGLNYYAGLTDDVLIDIDGNTVNIREINDLFSQYCDEKNISEEELEYLVGKCGSATGNTNVTNPVTEANSVYGGSFYEVDTHSALYWSTAAQYNTTSDFSTDIYGVSYSNHCGPTAITNLIRMIGIKKGVTAVTSKTAKTIFTKVATWGLNAGYFSNVYGTINSSAKSYMYGCFGEYGMQMQIYGQYNLTHSYVTGSLLNYAVIYPMLSSSSPYGAHHVAGIDYKRLYNGASTYVTFLKIMDGWHSAARYLNLNGVSSDKFWEVYYIAS